MSEIPYYFETPIPKYFRETGWFSNPNTILFVTWAFSKCSTVAHRVVHDCKELTLAPYEFITGRGKTAADCFLTEGAFRNQLKVFTKAGLLKKTTNSVTNRFTCYIWVTERFSKNNNQLNNQQTTDSQPTEQPQSRIKKKRSKKDLPSNLPSVDAGNEGSDDSLSIEKIEVYQGVFLTQAELDECIVARGDLATVQTILHQLMNWKGRKHEISDWVTTIKTWKLQNQVKNKQNEHEEHAKKLSETFPDFKDGNGWRCYIYRDKTKDQRGLLFESQSPYMQPLFIDFADAQFKIKCSNALRDKKMQKGRIKDD